MNFKTASEVKELKKVRMAEKDSERLKRLREEVERIELEIREGIDLLIEGSDQFVVRIISQLEGGNLTTTDSDAVFLSEYFGKILLGLGYRVGVEEDIIGNAAVQINMTVWLE